MAEGGYPANRRCDLWDNDGYQDPVPYTEAGRRFRTFDTWPTNAPNMTTNFVVSGLYYTGLSDIVRCAFCGVELDNWFSRDNPASRHRHESPRCPMNDRSNGSRDFTSDLFVDVAGTPPAASVMKTSSSSSDQDLGLPRGLETDGGVTWRPPGRRNGSQLIQNIKNGPMMDTQNSHPHLQRAEIDKVLEYAKEVGYKKNEIEIAQKRLKETYVDITFDSFIDEVSFVMNELIEEECNQNHSQDSCRGYSGDDEKSSSDEERIGRSTNKIKRSNSRRTRCLSKGHAFEDNRSDSSLD